MSTFPFPFKADTYRYSANLGPARQPVRTENGIWGEDLIDLDEHYADDLAERARILAEDPSRLTVLPHMRPACWDALLTGLRELDGRPGMSLTQNGDEFVWRNELLGIEQKFKTNDDMSPLGFLGSQIQDDVVLLDQREGSMWVDAGVVTFAADWSLGFDVGMRFLEVHGPVPRIHEEGIISRVERFLLRLEPGDEYRRTNWSLTVDRRLDQSTETRPLWAPERSRLIGDFSELVKRLHLRVEVQHVVRLGHSGAVMFLIRTHLLAVTELTRRQARQFGRVLAELPEDIADYKGLTPYRHQLSEWLLDGVSWKPRT